jgi:hypothetical protein
MEPVRVHRKFAQIHRGGQAGKRDAPGANRRRDSYDHPPARQLSPQAKQDHTGKEWNQHKGKNKRHKTPPSLAQRAAALFGRPNPRQAYLPLLPGLPPASAFIVLRKAYLLITQNYKALFISFIRVNGVTHYTLLAKN